jgi:hypothetical protein
MQCRYGRSDPIAHGICIAGHQSAARDVTFDDFILNTWNFCTMSMDEIRDAIFNLYGTVPRD